MADTKDVVEVASIAVFDGDGLMLWGKRRDNDRWTLPGGHLEDEEEASEAAARELREETGLTAGELESMGDEVVDGQAGKVRVHAYQVAFDEEKPQVTTAEDPDNECSEWRWIDVSEGLPKDIGDNLHSPRNVTLRLLGLQDWESRVDGLAKHDTPEFQDWFSGSVAVHPDGKPKTFYHGTSKDTDFSSFKIGQRGSWFTTDPKEASMYARDNDSRGLKYEGGAFVEKNNAPRVIPVHLAIKNPYKYTAEDHAQVQAAKSYQQGQRLVFEKARIKGHDGVDLGNGVLVAFHPHQIKSIFNTHPSLHAHIMKSEDLEKGLKEKALAAAIGIGGLAIGLQGRSPAPQPTEVVAPAPAPAPSAPPPSAPEKWTPKGLHAGLHPVAQLESSMGQNVEHAAHSEGPFHTAFGALGFKPISGFDQYQNSKALQVKHPGLDKDSFVAKFQSDPGFYNEVASDHWKWLQAKLKTPEKTAYGWRWGRKAAINATPQQVASSGYVKEYMKTMRSMKGPANVKIKAGNMKKAEALYKMAHEVIQQGMTPHRTSQYEGGLQSIETYQVPHNQRPAGEQAHARDKPLYHHVVKKTPYDNGGYAVMHMLSYDKEPFGRPISSSAASVRSDGAVEHGETATTPSAQGAGYGTLLYRRMLQFHGKMRSDTSVSPAANKVWSKVLADPGVTGAKGAPGTPEPHHAETSEAWAERPTATAKLNGFSVNSLDEALDNPNKRFVTQTGFDERPFTSLQYVSGSRNISHPPDAQEAVDSYGLYRESFLRKSDDDLQKMALKDVAVGQKIGPNAFDYNHLLTPDHQSQGLSLRVTDAPEFDDGDPTPHARLYDKEGKQVGTVKGNVDNRNLGISNTFLHRSLRGQQLGVAMYEALLSHAKNHLGLRRVVGEEHSTAASRTHQKLAEKHGLAYAPEYKSRVTTGQDYDDRAGPYSYLLKSESPSQPPPGDHTFWKPLKTAGDKKLPTSADFFHEAALRGSTIDRLQKMDFANTPPPKMDPYFVPKPSDFFFPHSPDDIRASRDKAWAATGGAQTYSARRDRGLAHEEAKGKWLTAFDDNGNMSKIRRLRNGLMHITGTKDGTTSLPLAAIQHAPANHFPENVSATYEDNGTLKIHRDHAAKIMESMAPAAYDHPKHHESWAIMLHELFHSVSHSDHHYENEGKGLRPHAMMEEASTEIPARYYSHAIALDHFSPPAATAEGEADRQALKKPFVFSQSGEVEARPGIAYPVACTQFARLVAFAHRRAIDGDEQRLNNAVINHALLAKRSPGAGSAGDHRLKGLVEMMMAKHGMDPKSTMAWDKAYGHLHRNLQNWLESDGTSKDLDSHLNTAQREYQRGKALAAAYGEP